MSNKTRIAGLLAEASSQFKNDSPLGIDLRTAALAVESMSDEAFGKHLAEDGGAEEEGSEQTTPQINDNGATMKYANGDTFWTGKAASLVAGNLVKSVTGSDLKQAGAEEIPAAKLPEEQKPDGKPNPGVQTEGAEPVPAAKLTPEQTTQDDKNHDSKIDAEAAKATPSVKEAAGKLPPALQAQVDKKKAEAKKAEAKKGKEASSDLPTLETEGVELFANLDDLNGPDLSAQDASLLGSIYQ